MITVCRNWNQCKRAIGPNGWQLYVVHNSGNLLNLPGVVQDLCLNCREREYQASANARRRTSEPVTDPVSDIQHPYRFQVWSCLDNPPDFSPTPDSSPAFQDSTPDNGSEFSSTGGDA